MPIGAQPRGRRGTVGHPYSALNLRLGLALFGVVVSAGLAVLAWLAGQVFLAWVLIVLGVVAAVDVVVVQTRRRARRREEGNGGHSLFE